MAQPSALPTSAWQVPHSVCCAARPCDAQALPTHVDGFSLTPHLQTPMRALSTGTQRKVWLTAALSAQTPVVLLDEPLNALDTASLRYVEAALADCAQQTDRAWIIVSHEAFGVASQGARVLTLGGSHSGQSLTNVSQA